MLILFSKLYFTALFILSTTTSCFNFFHIFINHINYIPLDLRSAIHNFHIFVPLCGDVQGAEPLFQLLLFRKKWPICFHHFPIGSGPQLRYRDSIRPQWKGDYVTKVNRHSFPTIRPRFNPPENTEMYGIEDSNSQHNAGQLMNGFYNYMPPKESPVNSPTKARFIERGVPEGAASVSPQDSVTLPNTNSVTTSPTMPHTITNANGKPLFYAMNV